MSEDNKEDCTKELTVEPVVGSVLYMFYEIATNGNVHENDSLLISKCTIIEGKCVSYNNQSKKVR